MRRKEIEAEKKEAERLRIIIHVLLRVHVLEFGVLDEYHRTRY